jgi:tRNA pseudouridine55 synthase
VRDPGGIVLVDKPAGVPSRHVVEAVGRFYAPRQPRRRRGGPRFRSGHAGTLDPLATGLLLVLVGRGTRLQPFLMGLDKRYLATVRLGAATVSLDRDGEVNRTASVPLSVPDLEPALAALTGVIMQEPPVVSALKRDGQPLHRLARRDPDTPPPPPRPVTVHRLEAVAVRWGVEPAADAGTGIVAPDGRVYEIDLDLTCSSGTYVRSLARDLAQALGTEGHVQALRRMAVGPFNVDEAVHPDVLAKAPEPTLWLRSLAAALPHLPGVTIDQQQAASLRQGGQPTADWLPQPMPDLWRFLDAHGGLVAVGRRDPETGLARTAAVMPASATGGDPDPKDETCA